MRLFTQCTQVAQSEHGAAKDLELETRTSRMEGAARTDTELRDPAPRTLGSPASLRGGRYDEDERHDDRVETIAVTISLILMISSLAAVVAAILLSRPLLRASGG